MTFNLTNVLSSTRAAAWDALASDTIWPSPSAGLAWRIFRSSNEAAPRFASGSLRNTTSVQLRRTPELAAFGYVGDKLDPATAKLWAEGFEHLRGRQIYPSDRQSFVFNPVELLGVAAGLHLCPAVVAENRDWFVGMIRKGLADRHFVSIPSKVAALAALNYLGQPQRTEDLPTVSVLEALNSAELLLVNGINLAFGLLVPQHEIDNALLQHLLTREVVLSDISDAASIYITLKRLVDNMALGGGSASTIDRVLTLCRRFPLFVEQLKQRQRQRLPLSVTDEYDVQDLMHALLKLHFDDVRPEVYTPNYAGSTSRVDFVLPKERIVVEAKMTRDGLKQKDVVDELIIDTNRYSAMDGVDTLVCLIYDPNRYCSNPKALETDVVKSPSRLKVHAVVCPQLA